MVYVCRETDLGFELPHGSCSGHPGATVVSHAEGHLSSRSVHQSGHGSEHCPWMIVVQPGKTIDLYVIDFSLTARYHDLIESAGDAAAIAHLSAAAAGDDDDDEYCHVYATVRELPVQGQGQGQSRGHSRTAPATQGRRQGQGQTKGHSTAAPPTQGRRQVQGQGQGQVEGQADDEVRICAGNKREQLVYSSSSNSISVRLSPLVFDDPTANFLFRYVGNFIVFFFRVSFPKILA